MEEYAQRVLEVVAHIPSGRVVAYGDIARALGEGGARNVGTVMSRYGSDVPWWRVIRADGRPPQGHDTITIEHWRAEGTPMVRGLVDGGRGVEVVAGTGRAIDRCRLVQFGRREHPQPGFGPEPPDRGVEDRAAVAEVGSK